MKTFICSFLAILFSLSCFSQKQKPVTVEGDTIYVAPKNLTREEAEMHTIELAKINALANKFGTIVHIHDMIGIGNIDGKAWSKLLSLSESDVKGEWIETLSQKVEQMEDSNGLWVFRAHVK